MCAATNRQEFRRVGVTEKVVLALSSSSDDVVKRALTVIVNTSFDGMRARASSSLFL
jgi:vacuolar-type H+-ATPase subunit B/Vma2